MSTYHGYIPRRDKGGLHIPCTLKVMRPGPWDDLLHELTGHIIWADFSAYGGYQVTVRLDEPIKFGAGMRDTFQCIYVLDTLGRDVIAELTDEALASLHAVMRGTQEEE